MGKGTGIFGEENQDLKTGGGEEYQVRELTLIHIPGFCTNLKYRIQKQYVIVQIYFSKKKLYKKRMLVIYRVH